LKGVFMQEMDHLEKITERIYLLEGKVVVKADPLPVVGNTAQDFMVLDHKLESDTISLYRQIIAKALELGDVTTRKMFEDIIVQEEGHFWSFDDFVK